MRVLRTALVLTLGGAAAVVAGGGPAAAATAADPGAGAAEQPIVAALGDGIAPVKNLTIDPLSGTSVDPLDNAVGSQVADFEPLSTALVTDPVTHGGSLGTLPVTGVVTSLLPG